MRVEHLDTLRHTYKQTHTHTDTYTLIQIRVKRVKSLRRRIIKQKENKSANCSQQMFQFALFRLEFGFRINPHNNCSPGARKTTATITMFLGT